MRTLTDLSELNRRACEALGWYEDDAVKDYIHHPSCKQRARCIGHLPIGCTLSKHLPAIATDTGVAIVTLVEFCVKSGLLWDLYSTRDDKYSCAIYAPDHNGVHAHVFGATPSEAIARALVAAAEAKEKR